MRLEPLESRVVLSYTFSYSAPVAMAVGSTTGAVDSLVLEPLGGFLLYSVNGAPFSGNWSGNTVPLSPTLQVDVQLSNGDGSSLTLGTPSGPASTFGSGTLSVVAPANTADTMLIDDSNGTTLASSIQPYSIDTVPGTVSGPGFNYDQNGSRNFGGGVTLEGSPVNGDLYNVLSVNVLGLVAFEPFTIITGSSGNSTVNVGSGGTLTISSPLSIYSAGGTATVNINDQNDTTSSTATLDDLSSNPNARFEVTGLSAKPIEYGAGVTALNIFGGTDGDSGVTYNFTSTLTNTTLNDGPNADTVNITGTGVAAGTPLTINDDTNTTVFYDAGGGTPVVAPGILGDSVVITLPGSGTVDANGIAQLNITNLSPIPIIPGPAQTINTVEGFNLFDAIATFQSPLATILPTVPGGPPVIDFAATIDWGDPSPDLSPGIITQGPSNPSVYHVVGAHLRRRRDLLRCQHGRLRRRPGLRGPQRSNGEHHLVAVWPDDRQRGHRERDRRQADRLGRHRHHRSRGNLDGHRPARHLRRRQPSGHRRRLHLRRWLRGRQLGRRLGATDPGRQQPRRHRRPR